MLTAHLAEEKSFSCLFFNIQCQNENNGERKCGEKAEQRKS